MGLALAKRWAPLSADLVEIDPGLAELAERNAARNGLQAQARILRIDALDPGARRKAGLSESADCVVTNPPFFEAGTVRVSPDEGKARAHVMPADAGATLADWISAFARDAQAWRAFRDDPPARGAWRNPGRHWEPARGNCAPAGSSDTGASAHRLLVSGVKGSKAPLRLAPGLILHGADGRLTAEADAIHRGERLIDWGG